MRHVPMDLAKIVASYLVKPVIKPHKWLPLRRGEIFIDVRYGIVRDIYAYWRRGTIHYPSVNLDWNDLLTNPDKVNILEQTINDIKSKSQIMNWYDASYMASVTKTYPEINNEFLLLNQHLIDKKYTDEKITKKSKQAYNALNRIDQNSCVLL